MRQYRILLTGFGPFPGVPDNPSSRLIRRIDVAMIFVALVALASLILEYGHYLSPDHTPILQGIDVAIVALFFVESIAKIFLVKP